MIYRNKYILIFLAIILLSFSKVFAIEKATIEYNDNVIDYSVLNEKQVLSDADKYFEQYLKTKDTKYLTTSMAKYYISSKIDSQNIHTNIQLARVYDYSDNNRLAKKYFNICNNIDKYNPEYNYYFGEYYFKRADYKRALRYYLISYNHGYKNNYDLNYKIGTIYEKLADLVKASQYYKNAVAINPKDTNTKNKISKIKNLNYDKSEYYRSNKK